jgi:negative regulator of replication initiation
MVLRSTLLRHALACANQAAPGSSRRREGLAEARAHLRSFPRKSVPVIDTCAVMFDGLISEAEGRPEDAIARYRAALPGLDQADTHLFAHAARDRLGRLIGGDEGAALRDGVRRWLDGESVREPETMLGMVLPGPGGS